MIQEVFRAGGLAARPRLHPGHRKRIQDERPVEGERKGPVAVHAGHRHRAGPQDGLVRRRAVGSREGHDCGRPLFESASQPVRRRLASGAGGVQRRPRPPAAGHEAIGPGRFLGAVDELRGTSPARRASTCRSSSPRSSWRRIRLRTGFDIKAEGPITFDKVVVPRAIDLRRAAEWTGRSIDEIQALNPELRRWTTPVKAEYELKIPEGTAESLQ